MKLEFNNYQLKVEERILISKCSQVVEGSLIELSGRNGAGKSSLLKSLYNLNYEGQVCIDGVDIKKDKDFKSKISFISQEPEFIEGSSINYHLKIHKINRKQAEPFINCFDQSINLKSNISKLSGGQRQIINIMLGLFKDSKYLVIDEPFNYLSKDNIEKLKRIIIKDERPCVIVTHNNQVEVDAKIKIEMRELVCVD